MYKCQSGYKLHTLTSILYRACVAEGVKNIASKSLEYVVSPLLCSAHIVFNWSIVWTSTKIKYSSVYVNIFHSTSDSRKSEQAQIPHASTLLKNAIHNDCKVCIKCKKLLNKRGTTSRNHINLNFLAIMLHLCLNYYKDSWTFVQQLERSCTENCFSSISKYGQTLEFKKGQNSPQIERLNEIPC